MKIIKDNIKNLMNKTDYKYSREYTDELELMDDERGFKAY